MATDLSKKKKGGFLSRKAQAAKKSGLVTEAELRKKTEIVPDDVLMLAESTEGEPCAPV